MKKINTNSTENLVDVEIKVTGGKTGELEDIYRYGAALIAEERWELIEADYEEAETGVTAVNFIGTAPETLIDNLRSYVGKTSAKFDESVKPAEEYPETETPPRKLDRLPDENPPRKINRLLNVRLTATSPTRFELQQFHTLLVHLGACVDHERWLRDAMAGDVGSLVFKAKITAETLESILGAIRFSGITLKGTINGARVNETIYASPILETDADIQHCASVVEAKRAACKIAAAKVNEIDEKYCAIVDELEELDFSELSDGEIDAKYASLKEERKKLDAPLCKANARYYRAREALQRADENLANCIRNKTSLYLESIA